MGGASGQPCQALYTPSSGPVEGLIKVPGGCVLRLLRPPPAALNQHGARKRRGGPSGPPPVHVNPDTRPRPWPLGALATTGRGFVVVSCCGRRLEPTAIAAAQPCAPQLTPAGMALYGPRMCTRPGHRPRAGRSTVTLPPCPVPLQLRARDAKRKFTYNI